MAAPVKLHGYGDRRTNPLIWGLAILCAGFATAIILTGITVFAIYIIYKPKAPYLWVATAHLDLLDYDQVGLLTTQLSLTLVAANPNKRTYATFSELELALRFHEDGDDAAGAIDLALLRADKFNVEKNRSAGLSYVARSESVPLDEPGRESLDASLKLGIISFRLEGHARWRLGVFRSVKFWTHLSCPLAFAILNGTALGLHCNSSKAR